MVKAADSMKWWQQSEAWRVAWMIWAKTCSCSMRLPASFVRLACGDGEHSGVE